MLYSEIIAICSQIHTKHINTLCGQNVEFVNVELGGTYSDQWAFKQLEVWLHLGLMQSICINIYANTAADGRVITLDLGGCGPDKTDSG
jgi:hypothetical protein